MMAQRDIAAMEQEQRVAVESAESQRAKADLEARLRAKRLKRRSQNAQAMNPKEFDIFLAIIFVFTTLIAGALGFTTFAVGLTTISLLTGIGYLAAVGLFGWLRFTAQ